MAVKYLIDADLPRLSSLGYGEKTQGLTLFGSSKLVSAKRLAAASLFTPPFLFTVFFRIPAG